MSNSESDFHDAIVSQPINGRDSNNFLSPENVDANQQNKYLGIRSSSKSPQRSRHSPFKSSQRRADESLLSALSEMGMDTNLSKRALVCTNNKSIEAALKWIAELGAEEMEALCHSDPLAFDSDEHSSDWEDCEEDDVSYKMVFVVNAELGMGTGKTASQVGHAALGLYRILKEDSDKYENSVEEWEESGERKITLRGKNKSELMNLKEFAEKSDLPTYVVEDAGLTQIPEGSVTVLAMFGDDEAVNDVTGLLRLL